MSKGLWIAAGIGALALATGVGAVIATNDRDEALALGGNHEAVIAAKADCRTVATNETGFDPATTPVPLQEDAGNKQVLKGTAVGAAVGAVAGEIIGDRAGLGAAAGAGAGAAGGQAVKADKQNRADVAYAEANARYRQQKAAYDAALQNCLAD